MTAMLVFDFRWSMGVFHYIFEILADENVGIDTQTKSLGSLIRQIYVIGLFHLISTIIR